MASKKLNPEPAGKFPSHVAIVPDGNGRWAEKHGWPRLEGHRAGADNMFRMVQYINKYPINYLTLYGFSTENWNRPESEVSGLFEILTTFIDIHLEDIHKKGIKLSHIGRLHQLPQELQDSINRAVSLTRDNTRMTLCVAFNYGGRPEIVDAAQRLLADGVKPDEVTEQSFSKYLYTADMPDVDLLIRTGDETRLSNFLIWQTAYSEYYFTKVLWPDFRKQNLDRALLSYSHRKRRFGGLG